MKTISWDYEKSPQEKEWENSCSQARMDAISFIGNSKKTSGRITGWLLKKGYPDSIVAYVIQELKDEGIINDEMMAAAIMRSHMDRNVESSSSALKRLIRLGIDQKTAKICVEKEYLDHNRELSDSIMLLRLKFDRKIDTIDELDPAEQLRFKQKIFRFLMNRGYDREIALSAMNNVLKERAFNEE